MQQDHDLINAAWFIALGKNYGSLIAFAAREIPWHVRDGQFIARSDQLSQAQLTVLRALALTFVHEASALSGHESGSFSAGENLKQEILDYQQERKQGKQLGLQMRAQAIAEKAHYPSPLYYAAAEIDWHSSVYDKDHYVAYPEEQSPDQAIILEALADSDSIDEGEKRHHGDYMAGKALNQLVKGT